MISANVVILTRAQLRAREDAAFQRGVERGKFEARYSDRDRDRAADETRSGSVERSEIEPGPKASPNLPPDHQEQHP